MPAIESLATALAECDVVDLSPVIRAGMPGWPSHPSVEVVADARTFARDGYFLQVLVLPEHSGCHVDAPVHVHANMPHATIDKVEPHHLIGPAKKVDASSEGLRPADLLTREQFRRLAERDGVDIEPGDIVLVDLGWARYAEPGARGPGGEPAGPRWWGANEPGFAEDLCRYLAERGVRAVGTDTVACDIAVVDGRVVAGHGHGTYFLPRNILIIEGLTNLGALPPVSLFVALPLRIEGGSGSPLRPVALVPRDRGSGVGPGAPAPD